VRTKTQLIESKRTDARQITIKAEALEKIWQEAWAEGRMPLLEFELAGRSWLIINRDDYLEQEGRSVAGSPPVVESG
jgi:Holliday junction resolvase